MIVTKKCGSSTHLLSSAPLLTPWSFSLTDEAAENESDSEGIPDYSQLRISSAKTLRTLEDVNTKLYIGTAVHIPTSKINIKQSLTTVQLAE